MIYDKHIFVCTNYREKESKCSCGTKDSDQIRFKFVQLLKENNLNDQIRSNKSGCFNLCEFGPVVVIYPKGIWYVNVRISDVEEIFKKSILKDEIIKHLLPKENILHQIKEIRNVKKN